MQKHTKESNDELGIETSKYQWKVINRETESSGERNWEDLHFGTERKEMD